MGRFNKTEDEWLSRKGLGEVVGGGFVVLARNRDTMRLKVSVLPFEWSTREDAQAEADRLASESPGKGFCVFEMVAGAYQVPMTREH